MWTREQLKNKAKHALDRNYWKIVLVSLLVALIGGGAATGVSNTFESDSGSSYESSDLDIFDELFSESDADYGYVDEFDSYGEYDYSEEYYYEDDFYDEELDDISASQFGGIMIIMVVIFIVVLVIASAIGFVYNAFIYNPLEVGTKRFFFKTLNEKAEVKEVAHAFDTNYKNIAKILFIRDLKVFLWSLLLVIPGIVKAYEYYMMPYLLAENPNLTKEEAFRLSKQMMTGNKWNTFVLEISFFWWDLLSGITLGIVGIFFVQPYKNMTYAALYEELSAINGYPARAAEITEENEWSTPY